LVDLFLEQFEWFFEIVLVLLKLGRHQIGLRFHPSIEIFQRVIQGITLRHHSEPIIAFVYFNGIAVVSAGDKVVLLCLGLRLEMFAGR
jgi:hypothetical protein